MNNRLRVCVSSLVVVCALGLMAGPVLAWNETGHMVVAYIAYRHLTPTARQAVDRLLALNPEVATWAKGLPPAWNDEGRRLAAFMHASTWPDVIKSMPDYTSDGDKGGNRPLAVPESSRNIGYADKLKHQYWHFYDTPLSTDGTPTEPSPEPSALTQLPILIDALKNPSTSDDVRSYDLVWISHIVSDLHQPLHTVSRFSKAHPHGDDGGNAVSVCSAPCRLNLHGLWDGILGAGGLQDALALGEQLNQLPPPAGVDNTDVRQWIAEGVDVAKQHVYVAPIGPESPTATVNLPTREYRADARRVAEDRAILAGRRLAQLLNDAFK